MSSPHLLGYPGSRGSLQRGAGLLRLGLPVVLLLGSGCPSAPDPDVTDLATPPGVDLAGPDGSGGTVSTDLATPECPSSGRGGGRFDVRPVTFSGKLLLNGGPSGSQARLQLRGAGGDQVALGALRDGGYRLTLLPGRYDLYYVNPAADGGGAPSNSAARLRADEVIPADSTEARLDIDVPTLTVRGTVQVNGQRPGGLSCRSAQVRRYLLQVA